MSNINSGRDTMDKVLDLVCDELDGIAKQSELTPVTLKYLDKLVDIKKDIVEIRAMEEYQSPEENMEMMSNGYYRSNGGYSNANGMHGNGYSTHWGGNRGYIIQPYNTPYYDNGMNGGGNMGNGYSNRMYMNSMPHYSRTGSEHEMIQDLRELAASASQEKKTLINNFIAQLEATK